MGESNIRAYINKQRNKFIKKIIFVLSILILFAFIAAAVYSKINLSIKEQSTHSVRNSIVSACVECYSVEGKYPNSLSYLEENYGLNINHRDYVVCYEAFSDNNLPEITVLVKGEG